MSSERESVLCEIRKSKEEQMKGSNEKRRRALSEEDKSEVRRRCVLTLEERRGGLPTMVMLTSFERQSCRVEQWQHASEP